MAHAEQSKEKLSRTRGLSVTAGESLVMQLSRALPQTATMRAEWNEIEVALVDIARRQANDIEMLEALLVAEGPTVVGSTGQNRLNPVFAELRQQRLALAKVLGELRLPDQGPLSAKNPVKQRAANRRWDRERGSQSA